ncbi:Integrase family protein [uncultured Sporomusa sp.]|uniref:Integrase family protein n=1 Tax=uncultured Sporomusa sp. TaxID=307249 RepID=A0A212LY25_9FIRM|nr:site-specific integrase [uncultured Sporomusa sp.]SCM82438.1 Integrase family protein [uncultured Sporomusa sp.]
MPSKIKKRGANSYLLTVTAGYGGDGKQITYTRTVKAVSLIEAKKMYNDFASEVQKGNVTDTGKMKLAEFAKKWYQEYCKKELAPKTQQAYKVHIEKRILPELGNNDINKIRPTHIMDFINKLQEPKFRLDGKNIPLGAESIKYCYRVLSSMLNDAVQWQIIPFNPCDRVKPPTVKNHAAVNNSFNEEQTIRMLEALDTQPLKYKAIILLTLATGLRLGELCGLQWSDLDLQGSFLTINRASQSLAGYGTFSKTPKNDSSNRVVTLPESLIPLLKQLKAEQAAKRLEFGLKKDGGLWEGDQDNSNNDRLFTKWNGLPVYVQTPSQWFHNFLTAYNETIDNNDKLTKEQKDAQKLPIIRFHDLRHTSGSLLIANGIPLKNVSSRLGHADIRTTGNIYTHALQSVDKQAANIMDNIISKTKKGQAK